MSDPKLNAQCAARKALRRAAPKASSPSTTHWESITADVLAGMSSADLATKYWITTGSARVYRSRVRLFTSKECDELLK